jgi:hypothetical protein
MLTSAFAKLKPFVVVPANGSRKLALGSATCVPPPRTTNPVIDMLPVSLCMVVGNHHSQDEGEDFDDPDTIRSKNSHSIVQYDD